MSREESPFEYGGFWLEYRRDGKSPGIWQIARYEATSRSVIYKSTREREVDDAKPKLIAHEEKERAKGSQRSTDARVIPLLFTYWDEKGGKNVNHDQTGRSLRTFIAFLCQDDVGASAVVTDMTPVVFDRFRDWRMGSHAFLVDWDGKEFDYASEGVSGDTVARNLNDIRAAINHAKDNMRIDLAPKIKTVAEEHLNPFRERILTEDELARIVWYTSHFPAQFRFVLLQGTTSVRPDAAKKFNPISQYDNRSKLIDLQPDALARTKKRNAVIPAIRPMRVVLRAWQRDGYRPVDSNKTAWRTMRRVLELSDDVFPKTIRHTIATWLYEDEDVPERQIAELLGHEGNLKRTSKRYAKYRPEKLGKAVRALTTIWIRTSRDVRAYSAGHLLTTGTKGKWKVIAKTDEKA